MTKTVQTNATIKGIVVVLIILIIGIAAYNLLQPQPSSSKQSTMREAMAQPASAPLSLGPTQEATLSYNGKAFVLTPNILKKEIPARITVDLNTVKGCFRSVTIPELGIAKTAQEGDNVIAFTPTQTGEFTLICAMGMGKSTFKVE